MLRLNLKCVILGAQSREWGIVWECLGVGEASTLLALQICVIRENFDSRLEGNTDFYHGKDRPTGL